MGRASFGKTLQLLYAGILLEPLIRIFFEVESKELGNPQETALTKQYLSKDTMKNLWSRAFLSDHSRDRQS